jgi:nitrogen regulatory protein PII
MAAKDKLEKVKRLLESKGIKSEIIIRLSGRKLEENLKERDTTMVVVKREDFHLVSDFPAILVFPNF